MVKVCSLAFRAVLKDLGVLVLCTTVQLQVHELVPGYACETFQNIAVF